MGELPVFPSLCETVGVIDTVGGPLIVSDSGTKSICAAVKASGGSMKDDSWSTLESNDGVNTTVPAAFGSWGNYLPAGLNTVTAGIGWFSVNSISGTFALSTLTGLGFTTSLLIVVLAQVFVAFIGHNFIHQFEKITFPYLAIVFLLATVFILISSNPSVGFNEKAPVPFGGPMGAFIIAFFIAASYVVLFQLVYYLTILRATTETKLAKARA